MKTKQSHTPGPWKVTDETDGIFGKVDIIGDGVVIAVAQQIDPNSNKPGEANARLIASCPTMLKALKMVLEEIDFDAANARGGIYQEIERIIKQAEGQEGT